METRKGAAFSRAFRLAALEIPRFTPFGALKRSGKEWSYMSIANAKGISMIMLEGKEMLQYIEERAAIENLDGLFIGPADLSAIKDAASTKLADFQRV